MLLDLIKKIPNIKIFTLSSLHYSQKRINELDNNDSLTIFVPICPDYGFEEILTVKEMYYCMFTLYNQKEFAIEEIVQRQLLTTDLP